MAISKIVSAQKHDYTLTGANMQFSVRRACSCPCCNRISCLVYFFESRKMQNQNKSRTRSAQGPAGMFAPVGAKKNRPQRLD